MGIWAVGQHLMAEAPISRQYVTNVSSPLRNALSTAIRHCLKSEPRRNAPNRDIHGYRRVLAGVELSRVADRVTYGQRAPLSVGTMRASPDDSKKDDSRERESGWADLRARHYAIHRGPRPAVGLRRVDTHPRTEQRKRRGKRRLRDHRDERSRERSGIKGWWSKRCWHRNGGGVGRLLFDGCSVTSSCDRLRVGSWGHRPFPGRVATLDGESTNCWRVIKIRVTAQRDGSPPGSPRPTTRPKNNWPRCTPPRDRRTSRRAQQSGSRSYK